MNDSYSLPLCSHPELDVYGSHMFIVAQLITLHGVSSSVDSYHLGWHYAVGWGAHSISKIVIPSSSGSVNWRRVVAHDYIVCRVPRDRDLQQIPTWEPQILHSASNYIWLHKIISHTTCKEWQNVWNVICTVTVNCYCHKNCSLSCQAFVRVPICK